MPRPIRSANLNADGVGRSEEAVTNGCFAVFFLGIILLGLAVFFLPRWIRTIITVVAFVAVSLIFVAAYASNGKNVTFFKQLHYGVGRLSKSLEKDLEGGNTARVAVVLGQLATQGTNGTASEYSRFVWKLVGEQEDTNRNAVATTNDLPATAISIGGSPDGGTGKLP